LVQLDKGASETTSELCAAAAAARVSVSVASMLEVGEALAGPARRPACVRARIDAWCNVPVRR
jgi:hypothetical protein